MVAFGEVGLPTAGQYEELEDSLDCNEELLQCEVEYLEVKKHINSSH